MSQVNFVVYDDGTGEILRSGDCPENMVVLQAFESNEVSMIGFGTPETHYVDLLDSNEIKEKLASPITINTSITTVITTGVAEGMAYIYSNGVDMVALDNVPVGSVAYFNGEELGTIADGELRFTTDLASVEPGYSLSAEPFTVFPPTHQIRISHLEYEDFEVNVYAI